MTTITLNDQISETTYEITDLPESKKEYTFYEDTLWIRLLLTDLNQCIFNNHELRTGAWDLLYIHDVFRYSDAQLIEQYVNKIFTGHLHIHKKQRQPHDSTGPGAQGASTPSTNPSSPAAKSTAKTGKSAVAPPSAGDSQTEKDPQPEEDNTPPESESDPEPPTPEQENANRNADSNSDTSRGDPVNAVTGAVVAAVTDFTLNTRIPLVWERHYTSRNADVGHLGTGWQCPADTRLIFDEHGKIICDFANKSAAVFSRPPRDEESLQDVTQNYSLSQTRTHYTVTGKSQITWWFPKTTSFSKTYVDRITDAGSNYLAFARDMNGLIEITDNAGLCIKVHSENNRILKMTRVLPDKKEIRLAAYQYHPDTYDLVSAWDMSDQPRTYAYKHHCLVRHTLKNNLSFFYEYDTPSSQGRCVHTWGDNRLYDYRFDYHPDEHTTKITNSLGYTETLEYNAAFKPVAFIDHENHETRYTYDDAGRPLSVTDPLKRTTQYEYDANGNLIHIIRPDNTHIHITCDPKGNPVRIVDPNGHPWLQEFDDYARLIRKITPSGSVTRYTYTNQGDLNTVTTPNGGTTTFTHNTSGDIIAVNHADNSMEQFEYDLFGNFITAIDPLGQKTRYTYDNTFRLTKIIKPSGRAIHCTYSADDLLTSYTDESGNKTRFIYTGTGQLQKKINPDNTEITYSYDTEEQLTQLTNERGERYLFQRDYAGRIISETDYWGNKSTYQYDAAGQLTRYIDPLSRFTVYSTDKLGRLTRKHLSDGNYETFNYDPNGNLIAFKNSANTTLREYDKENRLTKETVQHPHARYTTTHTYDAMGNRIQRISPFGNTIQYEYDILGRNTAININDNRMDITRNTLGLPIQETFENGLNRTYAYTQDNLLSTQTITLAQDKTINRSYEYDPVGNLTARMDKTKGTQYFTYDPMGRITQYTNPQHNIREYLHDPAGDLLSKGTRQHDGFLHMTHKGADYWFNAAGNLTVRNNEQGRQIFVWDVNNYLKEVRNQDTHQTTRMTYDALGRRTTKTTHRHTTTFTWDGNHLLSDNPSGTGEREFVYYPGTFEPLAIIDNNRNIHYVHNDSVGLPNEITDPSGRIVWSAQFDAQGNIETLYADEFDNPLRFQGQYYDSEIDLSYNRFRFYDSKTGSFVSKDPLGLAAGVNVYAYAPNVWGWVDPLGLTECPRKDSKNIGTSKSGKYGPFHRKWNEKTQTNKVADLQKASGELWGAPRNQSNIPQVQAHNGGLSEDQPGLEFFTNVPPDPPGLPFPRWTEKPGVIVEDGYAKIKITVTKINYNKE